MTLQQCLLDDKQYVPNSRKTWRCTEAVNAELHLDTEISLQHLAACSVLCMTATHLLQEYQHVKYVLNGFKKGTRCQNGTLCQTGENCGCCAVKRCRLLS